jgi:hypothetical protein
MDDGHTLMGRLYGGSSYLNQMMDKYAESKGWLVDDGYNLIHKGKNVDQSEYDFTISGVEYREGGVPYMDCFENASIQNDGTLTLYYWKSSDYNLQCTSGFIRDMYYCVCCDEGVGENDIHYHSNEGWCTACSDEYFQECDHCNSMTHQGFMNETHDGAVCDGCLADCHTECEDCGCVYHMDDTTTMDDGEVCKDCLDDYTVCNECDGHTKEPVTMEDGKQLCNDCAEVEYATSE